MSYENWKDKIGTFEVMDVRGKKMDFFPALKAKAAALKNGEGLHIIQTFEPVPLYPVLALMGFEHHTEKVSGSEYHIWFYEEIREYVKEHTGLNVSNLYIAQVKRKCGIKERQNYNKPKAENPKQLKCPPEKEKAIREALKYFKMI